MKKLLLLLVAASVSPAYADVVEDLENAQRFNGTYERKDETGKTICSAEVRCGVVTQQSEDGEIDGQVYCNIGIGSSSPSYFSNGFVTKVTQKKLFNERILTKWYRGSNGLLKRRQVSRGEVREYKDGTYYIMAERQVRTIFGKKRPSIQLGGACGQMRKISN